MKKYHEEANTLLRLLEHNESFPSIYLNRINEYAVQAYFSKETLYFEHNIGGMKRPSKTEATTLLEGLVNYYEELRLDSTDLITVLEDKNFVAVLVVFSGQMDFRVASWESGNITWQTKLED
mgnify:CR=1 FL=1